MRAPRRSPRWPRRILAAVLLPHAACASYSPATGRGGPRLLALTFASACLVPVVTPQAGAAVGAAQRRLREIVVRAQQQGLSVEHSFAHFDADGDGVIGRRDLSAAVDALGFESLPPHLIAALEAKMVAEAGAAAVRCLPPHTHSHATMRDTRYLTRGTRGFPYCILRRG